MQRSINWSKKDIIEFNLINGFKITKIEDNKIEKLNLKTTN